jgi:gamma-glutamyltranspeptidase
MEAGMLLRNPDLASVLTDIGRNGINGFYRGEVGAAIAAAIRNRDGFVTPRDLASPSCEWVETVTVDYRNVTVHELPPPTQGLIAMQLLRELGAHASGELEPGIGFVKLFRAARDSAYRLRDLIADPDFAPTPGLVAIEAPPDGGDTVYLCAADEHGNMVSMIQSVSYDFGSGIVAEGTGILLQNRGCYFSLDPSDANRLEPKKRTRHTLIPALATRDGRPWLLYGSMGGDGQPQLQTQVLVNLVDHGLEPAEAVARPRFRIRPNGATMCIEATYPGAAELSRQDRSVDLLKPGDETFGHAHAILIDGPGSWRSGADPRSDGSVERVG